MRELKFRTWDTEHHYFVPLANAVAWPSSDELASKDGGRYELMQYTGLKDRHGVEIYEGDILATHTGNLDSMGVMAWSEKRNGWVQFSPLEKFEVIGNIYENPELLK